MFKLNEEFVLEYQEYLQSELNKEISDTFTALDDASQEANHIYEAFSNYFSGKLNEAEGNTMLDFMKMYDIMKKNIESEYRPEPGYVNVKTISKMKFPENIFMFVETVISWIGRVIKLFIDRFTNLTRRIAGLDNAKKLEKDLSFKLEKTKQIQDFTVPVNFAKPVDAVKLLNVDAKELEKVQTVFTESYLFEEDGDEKQKGREREAKGGKDTTQVIQIDIHKEMGELYNLMEHFYNLFDNAYGSNKEHLFATDDLELMFSLFKDTIEDIKKGTLPNVAVGGVLVQQPVLDTGKLRDNLVRTKINTDKLKQVYVEIKQNVDRTVQVLQLKQMSALGTLGVSFKYFSAATYEQMIKIIKLNSVKMKDITKMEAKMKKVKEQFDKLVMNLGKYRQTISGFGQIEYTSIYQRQLERLFEAARYVNQTITLRLATLGLYIQQLADINELIDNANQINSKNRKHLMFK